MTSDTQSLASAGGAAGSDPRGGAAGSDPRERGAAIRSARAARVRAIRRRVVGGGVALFVAVWLLIAVVLVSGHDPALAARKTARVSSPSTNVSSPSGITTTSSGAAASGGATTSSNGATTGTGASSSGGAASSVTTRQS